MRRIQVYQAGSIQVTTVKAGISGVNHSGRPKKVYQEGSMQVSTDKAALPGACQRHVYHEVFQEEPLIAA
jgi:hypothetical protein